jgi:hypothetical protein
VRDDVLGWNGQGRGFEFQAELILELLDQGKTYVEVPTTHRDRNSGHSKAVTVRNMASSARFFKKLAIRRLERLFGK